MECIFCKIIAGKIPAAKIYEDRNVFAFLDIAPVNPGHILVIPKLHYETIPDTPPELLQKTMLVVRNLGDRVMNKLPCDGFNIICNNKPASGQAVPHVHFHIIPRHQGDGLHLHPPGKKYVEGTLEQVRRKLASTVRV
ncbi:HIT family protein [Candidatus Woesearchaeota archaeon]|nr:HIT family protein [Candidatus Woesearchaeota archaeon]